MQALVFLLAFAAAQEPGRITIDRQGTLEEVIDDLRAASGASLRVDAGIDKKPFKVKVQGAGFFEALDAICRAHGSVRYLNHPTGPEEGKIDLLSGPFLEYPGFYFGDFKVIVSELTEHKTNLAAGSLQWCRLYVVVLGPPWIRMQETNANKGIWSVSEVKDADGKDLLPDRTEGNPDYRIDLAYGATLWKGNVASQVFRLRPFDLDRGLSLVKGKVTLTLGDAKEIEVPLESGKQLETPAGTLTVDSVVQKEDPPRGPFWRMNFTLQPAKGIKTLKQAFETRYRIDGEGYENLRWFLDLPNDGMSFTASFRIPKPPALRIVARQGERKFEVPFQFKDVKY